MAPAANLLASASWRASGRARREILRRLRALGDRAAVVFRTDRKGVIAACTALDPRGVIRSPRDHAERVPVHVQVGGG
jgi:hypothetical protein